MSNLWNEVKVSSKQAGTPATTPAGPPKEGPSNAAGATDKIDDSVIPEPLRAKYKVENKVGKGAFGTAYLVADRSNNEKYVAKVMSYAQMTPKDKQHVKSEIDCLSQCNHVNIIRHIESFSNETTLVLVTEFADGGDLGREIQARKKKGMSFNPTEIACVFVQICLALDHVHSKGILHRDVKPANIFFTRRGLVKLGDFGFSKHYEDTISNEVGHTLCGTPYYLPPEMWNGEHYSKKADLWSLGVVLYEMMTLKRPFLGDSMKQLSDAVKKGALPPVPSAYEGDLLVACQMLLTVDSASRADFKDVLLLRAFQEALRSILKLLEHSSFAAVRENMSKHITSFLA